MRDGTTPPPLTSKGKITSGDLELLFKEFPLKGVAASASDLQTAQRAYAELAAYHGRSDRWRVFLAVAQARNLTFVEVIASLQPNEKRYLAGWAFDAGEVDFGLAVYHDLLSTAGHTGSTKDSVEYLHLLVERGRLEDAWTERDRLVCGADEGLVFLGALTVAMGRAGEVQSRLDKRKDRLHLNGDLCALSALVNLALGDRENADRDLNTARRLGAWDDTVRLEVAKAFGVPPDFLVRHRVPFAQTCAKTLRNLGALLEPSDQPSPHWFGGDTYQMPRCAECQGQVSQWFLIDLRVIPEFNELSRRFPLFPLLGCRSCWHMQEFVVNPDSCTVKNVAATSADDPTDPDDPIDGGLPQQFACLEPREPQEVSDDDDAAVDQFYELPRTPQVGGVPHWIHDPAVVLCRLCRKDMIYVAAMAPTDLFIPEIYINNGSGFQYHFVCPDCFTLSVLPQFS